MASLSFLLPSVKKVFAKAVDNFCQQGNKKLNSRLCAASGSSGGDVARTPKEGVTVAQELAPDGRNPLPRVLRAGVSLRSAPIVPRTLIRTLSCTLAVCALGVVARLVVAAGTVTLYVGDNSTCTSGWGRQGERESGGEGKRGELGGGRII